MSNIYVYDIESLSKIFTLTAMNVKTEVKVVFECSPRKNDWGRLFNFMKHLKATGATMVGYNNVGYDYPVLHRLLRLPKDNQARTIVRTAYLMTKKIINTPFEDRFVNRVPAYQCYVKQIDLMMINHFDNKARATSLKMLEFVMRMDNISEFDMDNFSMDKADDFLDYNDHDVDATFDFYKRCLPQIEFRKKLSKKYKQDMTNFNDTKIGEWVLVKALEDKLGDDICYHSEDGKRKMHQSPRDKIVFKDIIFDYIKLERPEFKAIYEWMSEQVITETKGVFSDLPVEELGGLQPYVRGVKKSRKYGCDIIASLHCYADDFEFVFGVGGIHGSVESDVFRSDDEHLILDCDVVSLYASIAIQNELCPEHLGKSFSSIYESLLKERLKHDKGTMENKLYKMGLVSAYGKSNSVYSPLYDPQFTMTITINGQLLLLMLCEQLMGIEGLKIIQVNTDGVTAKVPRNKQEEYKIVCSEWEETTKLALEYADYSAMFIRDTNNYVAVYESGDVKRKGVYEYERDWHQNHSMLVVPKCAEQVLLHGVDPLEFLKSHDDLFDFCLRTKIPKSSRLEGIDDFGDVHPLQRITRYFISNDGLRLDKIMPPLPKTIEKYEGADVSTLERHFAVQKGEMITDVSKWREFDKSEINYDFYLNEVNKITEPILGEQE